MENDVQGGKELAKQTLALVVDRVTNDNTVRYFVNCVVCWFLCVALGSTAFFAITVELQTFALAAIFGATGAMLSVAIRLREFALRPCQQSNMNFIRSATRIGVGFIAGPLLLILPLSIILSDHLKAVLSGGLRGAAILGLLGGFTERLLPNLLQKAAGQSEPSAGTPVQAARKEERSRAQAAAG